MPAEMWESAMRSPRGRGEGTMRSPRGRGEGAVVSPQSVTRVSPYIDCHHRVSPQSVTRVSPSSITIELTVNRRKYFWLFAPTQLLTLRHGGRETDTLLQTVISALNHIISKFSSHSVHIMKQK